MLRFLFAATGMLAATALAGCCGGPQCYDCAGCGPYSQIPCGPLDSMRQFRRSLTCGAGCGETYFGEWRSTPPDCVDPCPEFACEPCAPCGPCDDCGECCGVVGGCGIRPVRAAARLVAAVYGKRYCDDCGYSTDECGCGDVTAWDSYGNGCGCDSCGGVSDEGPMWSAPVTGSGGGCAGGNCAMARPRSSGTALEMARQQQTSRTRMASAANPARPQPDSRTAPPAPRLLRQASQQPPAPSTIRR